MENSRYGIIGVVAVLLSVGGITFLNSQESSNAYRCTVTDQIGIFYGGITSTGYTAYPFKENKTNPVYCKTTDGTKGKWEKYTDPTIKNVADTGLQISEPRMYTCRPEGCT